MKRTFPLIITAVSGFVLIVAFFVPYMQEFGEDAAVWFDILASIAFVLGGGNLLKLHLKKVSDKEAGWGYSAVTVVTFLLTLVIGLMKFGCRPTDNVEFYGETFAQMDVSALPVYKIEGSVPHRPDEEPLPKSSATQLSTEEIDGKQYITFQGWMTKSQRQHLKDHFPTLEWKCTIDKLYKLTQPSDKFHDKLSYYADHGAIAWKGAMTPKEETELKKLFSEIEPPVAVDTAVEHLKKMSRKKTKFVVSDIPKKFAIPETATSFASLSNGTLTVTGPMTTGLRDDLANTWPGYDRLHPLNESQRKTLQTEIEAKGAAFTEDQVAVYNKFLNRDWNAAKMINAIKTACLTVKEDKTACELHDEYIAGSRDIDPKKPAKEAVHLSDEQRELITRTVESGDWTIGVLKEQLGAIAPLTATQSQAIDSFLDSVPTVADHRKSLGLELLKAGPLSEEQRQFLFDDAASQFRWKQEVGELFFASHQPKYAWSGDFSESGSPFWWIYEYVFQPLQTTTFAMLAFYVSSAAFRSFRAKNLEATLLLGTAFLILLSRTYLGSIMSAAVPDALDALKIDQMTFYIMKIFNTAGNRAIMIGIALGIASTSLKVLLGIDRSYLGSGDD